MIQSLFSSLKIMDKQTNVCQYLSTKPEFIFHISSESMDNNTYVSEGWGIYRDELKLLFFCPICFIQCKQRKCWNISIYFLFFLSGLKMGAINKSDKNRSTYRLTFENVNVSDFNDYKQQSKNLKQTIFC